MSSISPRIPSLSPLIPPPLHRRKSSTGLYRNSSRPLRRPSHIFGLLLIFLLVWTFSGHFGSRSNSSVAYRIERLHRQAKDAQASSLASQSNSVGAARIEYKRRYNLEPPLGFDAWFKFAKNVSSPIIDDYDDMMEQLKPYRGFHKSMCDLSAHKVTSDDLVRICVRGGQIAVDGPSRAMVWDLVTMLNSIVTNLPNMCFVVNVLEQPRTVLSHKTLSTLYGPTPPDTCEIQHFQEWSKTNIWSDITTSCAHDSNARTGVDDGVTSWASPLIANWADATDLCSMPSTPPYGPIISPLSMRLSAVVRPMLSPSSLSSFHDVLFPSARHYGGAGLFVEDNTPWAEKKNTMAWRGDSSNGWASGTNWRNFQRQRMVAVARGKMDTHTVTSADTAAGGSAQTSPLTDSSQPLSQQQQTIPRNDQVSHPNTLLDYLDIGFTNITSCDTTACAREEKDLPVTDDLTSDQLLSSKLVLSMDGDGGDPYFYKLLKSGSAVVRQGLMREWHDSRLVPWLHYIPLSLGMAEMGEMMEFLLGEDGEGDYVSKTVAKEGKDWANKAMRREDQNVYMFRLLIEMGRRTTEK